MNTLNTINSTTAINTAAINDKYKYTLQDIMAEIKSLKINRNEGVKDKNIKLKIKLVKKFLKIRYK